MSVCSFVDFFIHHVLDAKSTGKSSASLNQVYYNGFTDGIVHILNELKKLNLLTQKQTEQFLAEEKERRPSAVFEFAGQSGNVTEASPGETMGLQGLPSVEELAKGTTSEFGPQVCISQLLIQVFVWTCCLAELYKILFNGDNDQL